MGAGIVAVFIPIIGTLVIGLILITYFYLRSRERQMLIEKGLDAQSIKEFFENKKDKFILMKTGVILIGFGIGLGIGLMLEDYSGKDYWTPLFIFVMTGLGFVLANILGKDKLENK